MVATALSLVAIIIATFAWLGYRHQWDQRDMDRFTDSLTRMEHVLDRMEMATFVVAHDLAASQLTVDKVAADLETAKVAVEGVAADLASAQHRADTVTEGQPGEAADAGAQSEKNSSEIT